MHMHLFTFLNLFNWTAAGIDKIEFQNPFRQYFSFGCKVKTILKLDEILKCS